MSCFLECLKLFKIMCLIKQLGSSQLIRLNIIDAWSILHCWYNEKESTLDDWKVHRRFHGPILWAYKITLVARFCSLRTLFSSSWLLSSDKLFYPKFCIQIKTEFVNAPFKKIVKKKNDVQFVTSKNETITSNLHYKDAWQHFVSSISGSPHRRRIRWTLEM